MFLFGVMTFDLLSDRVGIKLDTRFCLLSTFHNICAFPSRGRGVDGGDFWSFATSCFRRT